MLGAASHPPDALESGVLSAERGAMDRRLEADLVTLGTAGDAIVHLGTDVLGLQGMAHSDASRLNAGR